MPTQEPATGTRPLRLLAAIDIHDQGESSMARLLPWVARLGAPVDVAFASRFSTEGLPPPVMRTDELDALYRDWQRTADDERSQLRALVQRLPEQLRGKPVFLSGPMFDALTTAARAYDVLLLVSHQRHGLSRLVNGSVAARLLRHAPVPILVVGQRDPLPGPGEPLRILAPVDVGEAGALPWLASHGPWGPGSGSEVEVVHVRTDLPVWSPGPQRTVIPPRPSDDLVAEIRPIVTSAGFGHAPIGIADPLPNVGDSVVQVAGERGTHLIAMPTHGLRGLTRAVLGSVAERVVTFAPCAVLVVPWDQVTSTAETRA